MQQPPPPSDPMIASIDSAAQGLLARLSADGDKAMPLPEAVKAFEAIVKWAETRKRLMPAPEKQAGGKKFGDLKARLNGAKNGKAGRGAAGAEAEEADGSPAAGGPAH